MLKNNNLSRCEAFWRLNMNNDFTDMLLDDDEFGKFIQINPLIYEIFSGVWNGLDNHI